MALGTEMTETKTLSKQRRIRRSESEWRALFARYDQSGQTQEQFCAEQGLVLSSFTRWRQKLREAPRRQPTMAQEAVFVELASRDAEAHWDVELQLGAEVVLRLRQPAC